MRFRRRLVLLYVAFCAAMGIIWLRALQMQALDGAHWEGRARELRTSRLPLDAPRGPIRDADGVLLAEDASVFQLAVVGWEWTHRQRARCTACGTVHFPGSRGTLPRRCPCQAGAAGGSPRLSRETWVAAAVPPTGRLERLSDGDLAPLEAALGLARGELAARADDRVQAIDKLVQAYERRLRAADEDSDFLIDDKVELRRNDLLRRPYVVESDLPEAALRLVQTDETGRFRGFRVQTALRRRYPLGDFAPQLIGYTSTVHSEEEYEELLARFPGQITYGTRVGRRGLERSCNWSLHGKPGLQVRELEAGGGFTRILRDEPPEPGREVRLSVHAGLSREAEAILERWATPDRYLPAGVPSAAFVALDAETAEILLWAEQPRFDLNEELEDLYDPRLVDARPDETERLWHPVHELEAGMTLEAWRRQVVVPVPRTLSRIAQVAVEPGSTFKPLIALALLGSGRPLPFAWYECRRDSPVTPGCHGCGQVDLVRAIAKSCNRYFALSLRNGPGWDTYRHGVGAFLQDLGIGEVPGREVPEWSAGRWLWAWLDFPLEQAVALARERLQARMGVRAPTLRLTRHPRVPATVGGDPDRLADKLAGIAEHVVDLSGAREVAVHVAPEAVTGRQVTLRFGLRAARRPAWTALPEPAAASLPRVLHGRTAGTTGVQGAVARGGTIWFTAAMERRVGRTERDAPPVIRPDDGRNVAIGQGPVLVTPLQMARAIAAIANGGALVEPHAVAAIGGLPLRSRRETLGIAPEHLRLVREGMYRVVNDEEDGTARKQAWYLVPATVYGKTGTAQVGRPWKPFDAEEEEAPWHHWFVGFAEAPGKRTIAFACVLHSRTEAAAGGTAAGAVQEILARWYQAPASRAGR